MSASHAPSLRTLVERSLRGECCVEPGTKVLLAVSGGGDSTALLHVMASLRETFGLQLLAHGVDHGLRPEAPIELDQVQRLAASLGVEFERTALHIAKGSNLQARARSGRYAALRSAARKAGATWIATAHHADDRAETVLMRLMRGSGPIGLGVLPPKSGDLIRPLIRAGRADITRHLERHHLAYANDPSNRDPHYLRTRVRLELIPQLVQCAPGIVRHLNALADRMLELSGEDPLSSLALSRAQAEQLKHILRDRQHGAEIALGAGWVMKLEQRKLRISE